jgi:hypothetical protein
LRELLGEGADQACWPSSAISSNALTVFVGSDGGLALALDAPDEDWERLTA